MDYPSHLLDALGRVHAEAALDRLIRDERTMQPELRDEGQQDDAPPSVGVEKDGNVDGPTNGESSDNLKQPLPGA